MKKISRILSILLVSAMLCSCGSMGVTQEEYDKVVVERDEYKEKYEMLLDEKLVKETNEDIENETEYNSQESESNELIDKFTYEYDENNKVECSIVKDTEKETFTFLCSMQCEKEKAQFAALNQMQTAISITDKFDNYAIIYEIDDTTYCTLFEDGKMLKSDIPEIDQNSMDKTQTEKHLEYIKNLDDFLLKNNF